MPLLCLRSEVLNDVYQKLQKHNAVCGVHFSVNVAVAGTPLLVPVTAPAAILFSNTASVTSIRPSRLTSPYITDGVTSGPLSEVFVVFAVVSVVSVEGAADDVCSVVVVSAEALVALVVAVVFAVVTVVVLVVVIVVSAGVVVVVTAGLLPFGSMPPTSSPLEYTQM